MDQMREGHKYSLSHVMRNSREPAKLLYLLDPGIFTWITPITFCAG